MCKTPKHSCETNKESWFCTSSMPWTGICSLACAFSGCPPQGLQSWKPEDTAWEQGICPLWCHNVLGDVAACVLADQLVFDTIPNQCKFAPFIKLKGFFFFCKHHPLIFWVVFSYLSLCFSHFNKNLLFPHLSLPATLAIF